MKLHKIIILIFILFLNIQTCIANPIPVFVLFNWIPGWSNVVKSDNIYEYELNSHPSFYNKKYVLKDDEIYEYELNSHPSFYDKKYVLKDDEIYEYELNSHPSFYNKKYISK